MWHGIKNLQISLYHHLLSPEIWFKGYPFLFIALFLSFWEELVTLNSRYNSLLLLSSFLVLTTNIFHNSTRQYLIFLFLLVISLLLDLKSYLSRQNQTTFHLLRFYGITLSKGLVIRNILTYTPPARRIRKYLVRRLRIFFLPFSRPRKLRREIISRILAIEYLQLVINIFRFFPYFTQISTILYFILTITASSTIWFSQLMTNPPAGYLPLAAFYPIKFMTSLLVLYGLYTDTDLILALSYFGLITCCSTKFMREYISKKRLEYGGYPIPYGLNPYRVYVIIILKSVDFLWGIGGWCTIGTTFGKGFFSMNTNLVGVLLATILTLVLSDIWISALFGAVLELIRHRESILKKHKNFVESEDSELEEMGLIEQDSSKEFETITPLVPQLGTKNRPKRQLHEQLHSHEKVPPSRTYRPPRPFESTPLPHRRIGLTEIHSSQFSTTRRSR